MKKKGFMNRKIHLLNSYGKSFMKLSKYRLYEKKNIYEIVKTRLYEKKSIHEI